jgi:hypothetical protein
MSGIGRWALPGLFAACLAVPVNEVAAVSRGDALPGLEALAFGRLKSITAWLKQSGRDGYLAADVADAAGIPRNAAEEVLDAKQRGFRSGGVLRIAQIPADDARDFVLFMVQRPGGEVYFYLATVSGGLKKAFVSVPAQKAVLPIGLAEAQGDFQHEILYWEARIAGR